MYNNLTATFPAFIHGNSLGKYKLNSFGNYIGKAYNKYDGCIWCKEDTIQLDSDYSKWPRITMSVFISEPTPFLKEFFEKITNLNYPKSKITLLVFNNVILKLNFLLNIQPIK